MVSASARPDAESAACQLGGFHDHADQVRQQHLDADPCWQDMHLLTCGNDTADSWEDG